MSRLAVVEVQWVDAITRLEHCSLSDIPEHWATGLRHRYSVGYLVHQDKRRIVLASDFDEPEQDESQPSAGTFTTLPAGWVTKVTTIREAVPAPEKEKEE